MAEAVHISNENEGFEPIETTPTINQASCEQKEYFDQLIEKNDALGMFVFLATLGDSRDAIATSLYHSFPKGQKGKYQKIVDGLTNNGREQFMGIVDYIKEGLLNDDNAQVQEVVCELSEDTVNLVKQELNTEELGAMERIYND